MLCIAAGLDLCVTMQLIWPELKLASDPKVKTLTKSSSKVRCPKIALFAFNDLDSSSPSHDCVVPSQSAASLRADCAVAVRLLRTGTRHKKLDAQLATLCDHQNVHQGTVVRHNVMAVACDAPIHCERKQRIHVLIVTFLKGRSPQSIIQDLFTRIPRVFGAFA